MRKFLICILASVVVAAMLLSACGAPTTGFKEVDIVSIRLLEQGSWYGLQKISGGAEVIVKPNQFTFPGVTYRIELLSEEHSFGIQYAEWAKLPYESEWNLDKYPKRTLLWGISRDDKVYKMWYEDLSKPVASRKNLKGEDLLRVSISK